MSWRRVESSADRERAAALAGEASAEAALAAALPMDDPAERATDLTAAAFFDVDNTMMMGASMFHFARGLAARDYFNTSDLAGFVWQQLKFRVGGREDPQSVKAMREQALSFVAGRSVAELMASGRKVLTRDDVMQGVRVVEVAEHTFAPAAAMILADWGADVIKIERAAGGGDVNVLVQGIVDEVNGQRSRYEQIKRFEILPRDFSAEEDEVTPTLKLRRRVVQQHFADAIERLYE